MTQGFDVEVATRYGMKCAVVLDYINSRTSGFGEECARDGYVWLRCSPRELKDKFPYMSLKVIRSALTRLEREGLIVFGNYNDEPMDQTRWYAVTEKGKLAIRGKAMAA